MFTLYNENLHFYFLFYSRLEGGNYFFAFLNHLIL